jgi:hypothetical protein
MNIDKLMQEQGYDLESLDDDTYDALSDRYDEELKLFANSFVEQHKVSIAFDYSKEFNIKKIKK